MSSQNIIATLLLIASGLPIVWFWYKCAAYTSRVEDNLKTLRSLGYTCSLSEGRTSYHPDLIVVSGLDKDGKQWRYNIMAGTHIKTILSILNHKISAPKTSKEVRDDQ